MQVALKTLIVVHRTLREGDPTFREEILNYSSRGHILQISNFKDDSSPLGKTNSCQIFILFSFLHHGPMHWLLELQDFHLWLIFFDAAWDCSAWVRTYALYLEERLECFRVLKYDIESERVTKSPHGVIKVCVLHHLGYNRDSYSRFAIIARQCNQVSFYHIGT